MRKLWCLITCHPECDNLHITPGAWDLQKILSDSYVGKWKVFLQQLSALMKSWVSNHGTLPTSAMLVKCSCGVSTQTQTQSPEKVSHL